MAQAGEHFSRQAGFNCWWDHHWEHHLSAIVFFCVFFQPEVINLHFPEHQIPFLRILRKWFSFRLVVSLHGDDVMRWAGMIPGNADAFLRKNYGAFRRLLQEADVVTACSPYLSSLVLAVSPTIQSVIIPNGVEPSRFLNQKATRETPFYILSFGRLVPKKGFDLLLSAFAKIVHQFPYISLMIAGDGILKKELEAQAAACGYTSRVLFPGRVSADEVVGFLSKCLFAVIPSKEESFGIAALEAVAAGKPVLATRVGGMVELLAKYPQMVTLVEPTVEAIAEGLTLCVMRYAQVEGYDFSREQKEILNQFSWDRIVDQYEAVFRGEKGLHPKMAYKG